MAQVTDNASLSSHRHLLLVGAGHAHLHLVTHRHLLPPIQVTLVDPGGFWYPAMANGALGGRLPLASLRIDPARLAARHEVRMERGRLDGLDLAGRQARLQDGRLLPFTLLSLNLGSQTRVPPTRHPGPGVWAIKPIPCLLALHHRLAMELKDGKRPRLLVVGGGASAVEVAGNLRALARLHRSAAEISLVTRGERLLEDAPQGAGRWVTRLLRRRGIRLITATRVTGHAPGGALVQRDDTIDGEDSLNLIEADHVIHATGLVPPSIIEHLGLPVIPGRGLAVETNLQSIGDPDIFATGDCAAMVHHQLPRLGVFAIRQAPVLLANLAARLEDRPLTTYQPQSRALAILDLGEGQGLAIHGHHWWGGRLALLWKNVLDRHFLARYRLKPLDHP